MQKSAKVVNIDGYEDAPPFDADALKKAVAHQPVSVAIEASGRALQLYLSVRIKLLIIFGYDSATYSRYLIGYLIVANLLT